MLPVNVPQSSSDSVSIHYTLPLIPMTSRFDRTNTTEEILTLLPAKEVTHMPPWASSLQSNISSISITFARWRHHCGRSLLSMIALLSVQLDSKISNLCKHDLRTSRTDWRTDRQTDDMRYTGSHFRTYLLVTCGWRAWKLNSFKCPTGCWRRDASWRSTQTQLLRYEMIRSSSATQLCCWRRTFECLIAIDSSLVYICVLVCYNKYHLAGRYECDRYFLCP